MNEIKEGVDYDFVIPEEQGSIVNIRLLSEKFFGIEYSYGKVEFKEDEETEQMYLGFEFDVVNPSSHENLEENEEFKNYIGDILTSIITKQMENNVSEGEEIVTE